MQADRVPSRSPALAVCLALVLVVVCGCAAKTGVQNTPHLDPGFTERGLASWYGKPYHGRRTASGEVYDMHELTAAHRTLPFGSLVRVTNLDNGRSIVVRINDRGPFGKEQRIIDVSRAAARRLGMLAPGVVPVELSPKSRS